MKLRAREGGEAGWRGGRSLLLTENWIVVAIWGTIDNFFAEMLQNSEMPDQINVVHLQVISVWNVSPNPINGPWNWGLYQGGKQITQP